MRCQAALVVALVYIAAIGGRLEYFNFQPWPGGSAASCPVRQNDPGLQLLRGTEAERRAVQVFLLLLPSIAILEPHSIAGLVLVMALNVITVYAFTAWLFGSPRGSRG